MKGTRTLDIKDSRWGILKLLVVYPDETSPLGVLKNIAGTPWEKLFPRVTGEALSHALHGWVDPLVGCLGRSPETFLRVLPEGLGECSLKGNCIGWDPKLCRPAKGGNPCWEAGDEALELAFAALREGRYVLILEGAEFSL